MYNPYLYQGTHPKAAITNMGRQSNYNSGINYMYNDQSFMNSQLPFQPNYPFMTPYMDQNFQHGNPFLGGDVSNIEQFFDDPLYPLYENQHSVSYQPNNDYLPYMNPPRPNNGIGYLLNSFKDSNGNIDFNKMVNTAGQVAGVVNQVSGLFKGFTQLFKV